MDRMSDIYANIPNMEGTSIANLMEQKNKELNVEKKVGPSCPYIPTKSQNIEHLTKDLNNKLHQENFSNEGDLDMIELYNNYQEKNDDENQRFSSKILTNKIQEKSQLISHIPETLRDPLLILLIYIALSHPFVIREFRKFIPQLNMNENGVVPISGIIIYGVILALFYMIARKFLLE